jgi:hypothetical protein
MTEPSKYQVEIIKTFILSSLIAMIIFGIGCGKDGNKNASAKLPDRVMLESYFPLSEGRYWRYDWQNNRGDVWNGSMTVISANKGMGLKVYIVVDSTKSYDTDELFRSAYLWDSEGLKHLYRSSSNGDSVAFMPPRLVLPAKMDGGKSYRREYAFVVYNAIGKKRYEVNVRQNQKLIRQGTVNAGGNTWEDCIAIETVWTNISSDGSKHERRKVVWYSKDIGPVKIISEIPISSTSLTGGSTGELNSFK